MIRVRKGVGRQRDLWTAALTAARTEKHQHERFPHEARVGDLVFLQDGPPRGTTGWYLVVGRLPHGRLRVRPPGAYGNARMEYLVGETKVGAVQAGHREKGRYTR